MSVALWHNPQAPVPPNLMAELTRRGIAVTVVTNPFMALAIVCRETRRGGAHARTALVMVEPDSLPEAAPVHEALGKHAPAARCWMFTAAANPPLRAVVEADVERWKPAEPSPVAAPAVVVKPAARQAARPAAHPGPGYRTRPLPQPSLRITGGDGPVEQGRKAADLMGDQLAGQTDGNEESSRPSQLLTPEELRMLLGEDDPGQKS